MGTVFAPANSVTFPNIPNCSFYQWAKQDFLWLTSPAPLTYGGGGGLIVDSPAFYDVSPPSLVDGSRTFLPHSAGFIRPFALRAAQAGPRGLQLLFDRSGTLFEFAPAKEGVKPLVRDVTGQTVEIAHVRVEKGGKAILLDASGKVIQPSPSGGGKQIDRAQVNEMVVAQRFLIDGFPIFIDPSLAVIDVEQGEAVGSALGSAVLEAQTSAGGSLVYYATIVNDVYAYFATGVKDGAISATQFPTAGSDLSNITSFATAHGKTFPDANALAIEVKSAWIEAAGLPNASSYITMTATIPTYTPPTPSSTTTVMTATGQKTVQLALVGMHVVGSAAGHPEMIWSTFEHVANTPAGEYSYITNTGTSSAPVVATVKQSQSVSTLPVIGGVSVPWVFSETTASSFNIAHMTFNSPPNINANSANPPNPPPPFAISPSDTIRWKTFGGASDITPNPVDPSTAASNTEIISINNSVSPMLASTDVRQNYVMTGATWTVNGFSPIGNGDNSPNCGTTNGCPVGTSALSNTTMETYQQGIDNALGPGHGGSNCLTCHTSNSTNVSHVFGALKPLF
ncbi:MAG TPA: hypothetical protein VKH18_09895 [Terriglobales bacterium]|nr:hypothetical protein [Terriglobales bacterium]